MKVSLNKQIAISIFSGIIFATCYSWLGWINHENFVLNFLEKSGNFFINLLQLMAVPIVVFSLIASVSETKDPKQLYRIGGYTLILYTLTTLFAVTLGIILAHILKPGFFFGQLIQGEDLAEFGKTALKMKAESSENWVPNNVFLLLSSNNNLFGIVIFAVFIGISVQKMELEEKQFIQKFFKISSDIFSTMMGYIMAGAPLGTFAIVSSQLINLIQDQSGNIFVVMKGLSHYIITVLTGLGILQFIIYPSMVHFFSSISFRQFIQTMYPAQIFAFSSASSTATLPKTNEQVAKFNINESIRNFVLGLGATVNMDGTSCCQGIGIIFVTQIFSKTNLSIANTVYIIVLVTLLSIGVAGIPSASIFATCTLLLKLQEFGVLNETQIPIALAIILIPDRLLDMCRTATNITGDAAVTVLVASIEKKNINKKHP